MVKAWESEVHGFQGRNFRNIHQANLSVCPQCFSDLGSTVGTSLPYLTRAQVLWGYHGKWYFKVTFQACEDTGHCSWGNKHTAVLNVCYWTTGRAGVRASGTFRLVFVYAGFFSLGVGWKFQLLSHHPSHCNDNSHSFSSISCVFSNVLRTTAELAFNPPPHHTRTGKTVVSVTTFPHPRDPH